MAPSQGGQPEEVNFSKSSENRLPALKAIHKTTDKNRFSVIECTIQPQSFPDSLCVRGGRTKTTHIFQAVLGNSIPN